MTRSRLTRVWFALFGALMLAAAAACTPKDADTGAFDRASLQAAQDEYDRRFAERDFAALVEHGLPKPLLRVFLEDEGLSEGDEDTLRAATASEFAVVFASIDEMTYTSDIAAARLALTDTGRPYAFIPTVINIGINGMKMKAEVDILAIVDDGRWYFLNPADEDTVRSFKRAFPDLEPLNIKVQRNRVVSR